MAFVRQFYVGGNYRGANSSQVQAELLRRTLAHKHDYAGQCVLKRTLSCSLWTFLCRPGTGRPESCWCRPSLRPSARGSETRGTRWHRTYWHSNPAGGNQRKNRFIPVNLCPCAFTRGPRRTLSNTPRGRRGLSLLLMIQPQKKKKKPKQACLLLYGFISILLQCIRRLHS